MNDTPTDFPILDADRSAASAETGRHVCDEFPPMEPYIGEMDNWCTMPLRLAYSATAGFCLEIGPYDLDAADIRALRRAIAAYDDATRQATDEQIGTRVFDWPEQDDDR